MQYNSPERIESTRSLPRSIVSKTSLFYLLGQWVRQSWDELGSWIYASSFLFAVAAACSGTFAVLAGLLERTGSWFFPPAFLLLLAGGVGTWFVTAAWFAVNRYIEQILTFRYPDWRILFFSFPRYLLRSLGFLVFFIFLMSFLLFNGVTYPRMFEGNPMLQAVALCLTGWMFVFLGMVQVHAVPFLVHQDRPLLVALKRSALVAVWKPVRTAFILFVEIVFFPLSLFPPFCFLLPGIFAVLTNLSLLILLEEWQDPYEKTPEAIRAGT